MTGMLRRWRVLWDRRRNPYSSEYSTMYSSCGHTVRERGDNSAAGPAHNYRQQQHPWLAPPSHCLLEKRISCKNKLQAPFGQFEMNRYQLFETAAHFLDVSPQSETSEEASGQPFQALLSAVHNLPAALPGQPQASWSLQFLLFVLFRKQQENTLCNC